MEKNSLIFYKEQEGFV